MSCRARVMAVLALELLALLAGSAQAQTTRAKRGEASIAKGAQETQASETSATPRARAHRNDWLHVPATPDGVGVFTQPFGSLALLAPWIAYVPVGINLPITDRTELAVEVTFTTGDWYGCGSQSSGGWAALGLVWFATERKWLSRGAFLEPKLVARYFDTEGAGEIAPRLTHLGCFASDVANINQSDYELHLGFDAGYSMRMGLLELAFVIGLSVGPCHACFSDRIFFLGQSASPSASFRPPPPRTNRWSLGLNLNLFRLGLRF